MMKEWLDQDYPGLVTLHNLGVGTSASSCPPGRSGLDMVKQGAALKPDVVFIMTDDPERVDRLLSDRIHPQLESYRQVLLPELKRVILGQSHQAG